MTLAHFSPPVPLPKTLSLPSSCPPLSLRSQADVSVAHLQFQCWERTRDLCDFGPNWLHSEILSFKKKKNSKLTHVGLALQKWKQDQELKITLGYIANSVQPELH